VALPAAQKTDDSDLKRGFLVHMYHEIVQPYALYNLIPALKPGARVGIVDAFSATVRREPDAAGSYGRVQGAIRHTKGPLRFVDSFADLVMPVSAGSW
jgi:hypothetical protein